MSKKQKKPNYAAANILTGAVIKEFKSLKKLAKYVYTPKTTVLGTMRPYDFYVRPVILHENGEATIIEFTD